MHKTYQNCVEHLQENTVGLNLHTISQACKLDSFQFKFSVYFEASNECHELNFNFGQTGVGTSVPNNRQFSIKVTQYSCDYNNLAPAGCDQWFFGSSGTGTIMSFNYDTKPHLANQHQNICVRYYEPCLTCRF